MHHTSEKMADFVADRIEFLTFLASVSALMALLTGMEGERALAFTALNLPIGLLLLVGLGLLSPLAFHWRLLGTTLLLTGAALTVMGLGASWITPIAVWCVYGLMALEVMWQARASQLRLATR
ncbi:hypothetical protein [Aeromonas simiae]|uniref:hypothetical protein n=1 Tax=Aeromonas simiae TaxID=218936 RepID=UPI0005A9C840|nr:hypothetical protein [Aeromonas simiae]MDO2947986.1 hypothetical protein [Aeromonas simiae]MDO2952237.1 hypothetical protein [Aeromonas simiae]MDO2955369.1 hypothetical protein [Aeromonas simiae]